MNKSRKTTYLKTSAALATVLYLASVNNALAQIVNAPEPPENSVVDNRSVDVSTGLVSLSSNELSIGGEGGLYHERYYNGGHDWRHNHLLYASIEYLDYGQHIRLSLGGRSESFIYLYSTGSVADKHDGTSLAFSGNNIIYTTKDGTVIKFDTTLIGYGQAYATSIVHPDGRAEYFHYKTVNYQSNNVSTTEARLQSVTSSNGYQLKYNYASNIASESTIEDWRKLSAVSAINNAVEYCDPSADSCSLNGSWPKVIYTNAPLTESMQDPQGNVTQYRVSQSGLLGITPPGFSSETKTYNYIYDTQQQGGGQIVQSVVDSGGTWTYTLNRTLDQDLCTYPDSFTATVTAPGASVAHVYQGQCSTSLLTSETDELGRTTSYEYGSTSVPTKVTFPEGNIIESVRDNRANSTQTKLSAKAGSGLPQIIFSAVYPASCSNPKTCNNPTSTTDARGNVTDYTYDPTHGGILTVTLPAGANGVRPQKRYSYSAITDSVTAQVVYLLTGTSVCQTSASCAGTADEIKTSVSYEVGNLLPISTGVGAGDGSLTAITALSYDSIGNAITLDGPLLGTADTTMYTYDANRRRTGMLSADPDGAGPRRRLATKTYYNGDGSVNRTEVGTSDANWSGYAVVQQTGSAYDAYGRKISDTVSSGSTTYAETDYGYDGRNRPSTTTVRMFGQGSDRTTLTGYNAADQITSVTSAYGTSSASTETMSYTSNSKLASVTDANGNKTSYVYDGFDRRAVTYYPSPSSAGTSSSTDYEQLTYDANSNVATRRLRDGNSVGYTYDALNRVTYKDLPNIVIDEFDVSYTYDLLGRPTHVEDTNTHFATFWYDALSRETSEQSNWTTRSWQYDLAGRKTRLTWQDGFYVSYDYDTLGEMTAVRENGASSGIGLLATYGYDDLGRRTSLVRGNGTSTTYGYDNASRLISLGIDLAGTGYDQNEMFGYNAAGQITSATRSNDAYAYASAANRNDSSGVNGLNQITSVGANSIGYDGRGNINSAASVTYAYTGENKLATSSNGYTMTYDPLGRYHWIANSGSLTWMQYDGSEIVEELQYPGGAIAKRYVWGASIDEPLIEYDASGNRTWLHADERGSIVARTNDSGSAIVINTYDEYGVPGSGNVGRFQYTGQAWIPELGLYYYKARMYSSRLGRFMQTDPIGYGDGLNWYNHVGGDPINRSDTLGLQGCTIADDSNKCVDSSAAENNIDPLTGPDIIVTAIKQAKFLDGAFFGSQQSGALFPSKLSSGPQRGSTKPIPPCMQAFLNRAHPGFDYSKVQLVNGLPPGFDVTDNNVTFGNTIYLDPNIFRDVGVKVGATTTVFHEITHARDYAEGRLSVGGYILDSARYRSHDSIPSEIRANAFMNQAMTEYKNSPEARGCPR